MTKIPGREFPPGGGLWRQMSALFLIAANLVPLAGALAGSWTAGSVIFLFWFECLIVGAFTVVKLLAYGALKELPPDYPMDPWAIRGGRVIGMACWSAVFVVHFGFFCLLPSGIVVGISGLSDRGHPPWEVPRFALEVLQGDLRYAVVPLFISHAVSFVLDFLVHREYRRADYQTLTVVPYLRVMPVWLALLPGIIVFLLFESPLVFLLLLTAAKIGVDLKLHLLERRTGLVGLFGIGRNHGKGSTPR